MRGGGGEREREREREREESLVHTRDQQRTLSCGLGGERGREREREREWVTDSIGRVPCFSLLERERVEWGKEKKR